MCLNHHLLLIRLPSALCSAAQRQNIPSLLSGPAKGNSANLIFAHYVRSVHSAKKRGKFFLCLEGKVGGVLTRRLPIDTHTLSVPLYAVSCAKKQKLGSNYITMLLSLFFSLLPLPAIFFELYAFRFVSDTAQYKHVKYQGLQRRASEHDQKGRT